MRGRIKKALSGFYYVDTGEEVVTCRARGRHGTGEERSNCYSGSYSHGGKSPPA